MGIFNSWIRLLALAVLSSVMVTAVDLCRCESANEDLYSHRRLAHEIHSEHGFDSVKIDSKGYYIVDRVRVVPPAECEHHKSLFAQEAEVDDEPKPVHKSIFSMLGNRKLAASFKIIFQHGGGIRGNGLEEEQHDDESSPDVFPCDTHTVKTPPKHTGMPKDVEDFLLLELRQPKYVLDDTNHLVKQVPLEPFLHKRPDGTVYLVESEINCQELPLPVLFNRRAVPFHCRCPENVEPRFLPLECHDKV